MLQRNQRRYHVKKDWGGGGDSRISKKKNFIEIILLQDFKFVIYQRREYFMLQDVDW
jgi:hypothetical protein